MSDADHGPDGGDAPDPGKPSGARSFGARNWRPVESRPGEGWEVLPPLRWVLLSGIAALILLVATVVAALVEG